jgi:hypothetical protein
MVPARNRGPDRGSRGMIYKEGRTVGAGPVPRTPHHEEPCMSLAWLLYSRDPHPVRTSAGVPSPAAGRSHSAPPPVASRTRIGRCPGERPDPGVAALGWGRRGWLKSPSAACQNWRAGFGGIVCCYFSDPEYPRLPKPGPSFGREEACFRLWLGSGTWCAGSRFRQTWRVVPPDKESRCDHQIPNLSLDSNSHPLSPIPHFEVNPSLLSLLTFCTEDQRL